MSLKKITLKVLPEHQGLRIDQFLALTLPAELGMPVSKAKVRKLIIAGAVYLNRRRLRIASRSVFNGAQVEAMVDLARLNNDRPAADAPFVMTSEHVLFEDEWLIVVNKPPGIPTQPTLDEARNNLYAEVKRYLAGRTGEVGPYLGLHHRLDRDTSGVILFTKKMEANAPIAELFKGHRMQKTYCAIVKNPNRRDIPSEWTIKNHLGRARGVGKKNRWTAVRSGGDFAHTEFKFLEAGSGGAFVEARPLTGRTHQIRVHLSEFGLPIWGDVTYGGRAEEAPRVMLHAAMLVFPHPVTREELRVNAFLPGDFQKCLEQLRQV